MASVNKGLVSGIVMGSFTLTASNSDSVTETVCSNFGPPICPLHTVQATAPGNVQVPTYLYATGMTKTSNPCELGEPFPGLFAGSVHYQVLSQDGTQMAVAGMTPEEQLTVNGKVVQTYKTFSTPVATGADGLFDDVPVGACFNAIPPVSGPDACQTVIQNFQVSYGSATYAIKTTATQLQCYRGVRVSATGNPTSPTNKNFTYTLGNP
jgi:hypothetical protein